MMSRHSVVCYAQLAMRTFVALDLDSAIQERILGFIREVRDYAPDVRWMSSESLHITLKFIGEQPDAMVHQIETSLRTIQNKPFQIGFSGCGFFPMPRAARVFWVGIEADEALGKLARTIDDSLGKIGIAKEDRIFSPHLTLARARGSSGAPGRRKSDKPNRQFTKLQAFLAKRPAPEFGSMTARDVFLYRSQLSNQGSQYTKIAAFNLEDSTT